MSEQSPVKITHIDCFVCLASCERPIKLNGRKSETDGFIEKLEIIINDDSIISGLCASDDTSVCRNCYKKIMQTCEFINLVKNSANRYASGVCARIKRCGISPVTPKSVGNQNLLVCGKSRKQLRFASPEKIVADNKNELNNQPTAVNSYKDHSYSQPACKTDIVNDQSFLMSQLQKVFAKSLSSDEQTSVVLRELRAHSSSLTSRTASFSSVLYQYRNVNCLEENADHFLDEVIKEMMKRVPFLLKVMLCVATPANEKMKTSIIPAVATAYSILMKHKYDNLSALQRLTTIIAIRGGLDERAQTRLNKLGLMLSWCSRTALQESMQTMSEKLIVERLKQNPLIKITGDNLDIYVRASHLSKERRNKDLHLFTSNVIFSRVATVDMSNAIPMVNTSDLNSEKILMLKHSAERDKLLHAYSILLARIACKIPAFKCIDKFVPKHLPHEFSEKMSRKSEVHPLPIIFKNETKHEDCMAIMDTYEQKLIGLYNKAFGNIDVLRKYGVPIGGDQLTRVRLQEAKCLRTLSILPERRYEDLHPIVCEMWHTKQDFLEKCYKKFFKVGASPCTLNYFKTILHRNDVNGEVKGRFKAHFELLMMVGEQLVVEQFLEFLQMDSIDSQPKLPLAIELFDQAEEKYNCFMTIVNKFITFYGYGMVDHETCSPQSNSSSEPDELYNYSMQLCHWYLHLSEIHDTAREGDLNRTVINCQYILPFFYSHSRLSKYLVENVDFILKCNYFSSPLQRIRVLEGSYVNKRGGKGQNVESDLTQEHSVCNQKALIKSLAANKSEQAIQRITGAADTVADICTKFDENVHIKPKSGYHSKPLDTSDQELISRTLRTFRPFHFSPGRKCPGFSNIGSLPVKPDQIPLMKERLDQIISRLTVGLNVSVDEDDEGEGI